MATKGFSETFLMYKENVPDTRESPMKEMVKELKEFGIEVFGGCIT